jgi:hypothetical protein
VLHHLPRRLVESKHNSVIEDRFREGSADAPVLRDVPSRGVLNPATML